MHARTTPRIIVLALLSFELCHCNANVDSMTQEVKAASAYNAHRVMLIGMLTRSQVGCIVGSSASHIASHICQHMQLLML